MYSGVLKVLGLRIPVDKRMLQYFLRLFHNFFLTGSLCFPRPSLKSPMVHSYLYPYNLDISHSHSHSPLSHIRM